LSMPQPRECPSTNPACRTLPRRRRPSSAENSCSPGITGHPKHTTGQQPHPQPRLAPLRFKPIPQLSPQLPCATSRVFPAGRSSRVQTLWTSASGVIGRSSTMTKKKGPTAICERGGGVEWSLESDPSSWLPLPIWCSGTCVCGRRGEDRACSASGEPCAPVQSDPREPFVAPGRC
jgi:hypothetical protein